MGPVLAEMGRVLVEMGRVLVEPGLGLLPRGRRNQRVVWRVGDASPIN